MTILIKNIDGIDITEYVCPRITPGNKCLQLTYRIGYVDGITPVIAYQLSATLKEWALDNGVKPDKLKYSTREIANNLYALADFIESRSHEFSAMLKITGDYSSDFDVNATRLDNEAGRVREMADYLYTIKEQI